MLHKSKRYSLENGQYFKLGWNEDWRPDLMDFGRSFKSPVPLFSLRHSECILKIGPESQLNKENDGKC